MLDEAPHDLELHGHDLRLSLQSLVIIDQTFVPRRRFELGLNVLHDFHFVLVVGHMPVHNLVDDVCNLYFVAVYLLFAVLCNVHVILRHSVKSLVAIHIDEWVIH